MLLLLLKGEMILFFDNFKIFNFHSFHRAMMTTKIAFILLTTLFVLPSGVLTRSFSKCPDNGVCRCDLDDIGRYITVCANGNMTEIPTNQIDEKMEIIIVHNPLHTITIGNIFTNFKKLQVLRITESNIPAIGFSFWDVPSLRTLDLSMNNITHITQDNFRYQEKLNELVLSGNKIGLIPSGTFVHLKVRKLETFQFYNFLIFTLNF